MPPHIVVVTTGGTIAMRYDPAKKGDIPAVAGQELITAVPALAGVASLEVVEFANIPSFHMTPAIMLRLARVVEALLSRADVDGVVVTHGTDTLEESAFFLDCYLPPGKPVCFTGAMRNSGHAAPDGPCNILAAVRAAASPDLAEQGVLVVMNDEIHAARYVTKTHTASVATFASPFWGPLGHIEDDTILVRPFLSRPKPLRPERLPEPVPILKVYTGMDSAFLEAVRSMRPAGLILEGFGRGNFPADIVPFARQLLDDGVTIIAASRVPAGRTLGVYAAEGGGAQLCQLGVLCSGQLNSQKARILLLLALGLGRDRAWIAGCFNEGETLRACSI